MVIDYRVFDANPADAGDCSWDLGGYPDLATRDEIDAWVLDRARACGEYDDGDRLWVQTYDDAGICLAQWTVEI